MTVAPPRPIRLRSVSTTAAPALAASSAAYMPEPPEPITRTSVSICVGSRIAPWFFLIFMALELLVESTSSGETDEARLSPGNPNGADLRQHAQRPNVQIGGRRTKALAHSL